MTTAAAAALRIHRPRVHLRVQAPAIAVRAAVSSDVTAIYGLIVNYAAEGRLLERSRSDIAGHLGRFAVATIGSRVVGCADLAPLSRDTAEVRSLVVAASARSLGIGRRLLMMLVDRARRDQHAQLCAFTHAPAFFTRAGFSSVPHTWLPEKIAHDCGHCSSFRRCGQYAMVLPLTPPPSSGRIHG